MTRRLALLVALAVTAATFLVARPAEAVVGDNYTWVATGAGNFADPLNWTRSSDGQHGVPGSDDSATISDPPGTVTVSSSVTVDVLLFEARSTPLAPRGDTKCQPPPLLIARRVTMCCNGALLLAGRGTS